jgi:hypothetical protein
VTCDYCHSIKDVSLSGPNPKPLVDFSIVKSGPFKDADASAHGTMYSEVHTSAAICATCHDYRNSLGFHVLTTYSEWKNSRYSKDSQTCQSCHMYHTAGDVVDPWVRRTNVAINLHQMPGSHSIEQLTKTITMQLSAARQADQVLVQMRVNNRAAGHYVPTGSPLRQLILDVSVESSDGRYFEEKRVYRRTVADHRGETLTQEHLAFMTAAKEVSDSRLAPGEQRTESFSFVVPAKVESRITAALQILLFAVRTSRISKTDHVFKNDPYGAMSEFYHL